MRSGFVLTWPGQPLPDADDGDGTKDGEFVVSPGKEVTVVLQCATCDSQSCQDLLPPDECFFCGQPDICNQYFDRCLAEGQPNFGMVGLFHVDEARPLERPSAGSGFQIGEVALVFYVADIESSLTTALMHGGTRVSGPLQLVMPHRAQPEAMLRDPDGVLINLVERPPVETFGYEPVRLPG